MKIVSLLAIPLFLFSACDRPVCTNTNPIFAQYSPFDKEYKNELLKQLKLVDRNQRTYWINAMGVDTAGQQYIDVYIQGGALCANAIINLKPGDRFYRASAKPGTRAGYGYHGAELIGLEYVAYQDASNNTWLEFKSVSKVID